jgi:predicted dehydrogenase
MGIRPVRIGVIGCGDISGTYLSTARKFKVLEIAACADLETERSRAKAEEFNLRACSSEQLLADSDIEVVLNLTPPNAHFEVAIKAIEAGKSVYDEKPLAATTQQGRRILDSARAKGLLVGCAPDTFLGAGLQTCRKLIDEGLIGEPVAAAAFVMCRGHEDWHPNPEFYYKPGGGPLFDMGPYYLTALVSLLGPVRRVAGSTRISFPERTITSEPKRGGKISVEVPTHVAGVLDFANGAIATLVTSFDVWGAEVPFIEIYGSEGTLSLPDPNCFGGPVRLLKARGEWEEVPLSHGYGEENRSIGLADLACALRTGRPHRANGEMAFHVLDIMCALHASSAEGKHSELHSSCERPAPLPARLQEGTLDE